MDLYEGVKRNKEYDHLDSICIQFRIINFFYVKQGLDDLQVIKDAHIK